MSGGFTQWAHLRLRDHRPGPMSYDPPPSDAPQKSIFFKHNRSGIDFGVGPDEYQIPSTIGQCRSTVFGSPNGPPSAAGAAAPQRKGRRRRSPLRPLAKQYSLALMPDTPAFSIYPRVSHEIDKPSSGIIGPGEYIIPSAFDPLKSGVPKGPCFGQRTFFSNSKGSVPGPGSYNLPRFGDDLKKKKEYITSIRKVIVEEPGPGPGCYDDPTTIAARVGKPQRRLADNPSFGCRYASVQSMTSAPGPSAYGDVSRIMQKPVTRTPVFRPLMQTASSHKIHTSAADDSPGPGTYCIPSEFDPNFRKGTTLSPRLTGNQWVSSTSAVGPGQYDLDKSPSTTRGFRFARSPYDPVAVEGASARSRDAAAAGTVQAMYEPNYNAVEPNKYRAVRGFGLGTRFNDRPSFVPLCYDVRPPASSHGTVFHRGDYSRRKALQQGQGPIGGGLYNVDNGTIDEGVRTGKGFTFGIRYPARATHQVCKPRDETTNMNCEYPDEQTWMTKITVM